VDRPWLRHYDDGVPATLSYPNIPLFGLLEESARRFPNRPAVVLAGPKFSATLTYRRLDGLANRFANALIALGVRPGDRVMLHLPNLPQFVVCFYGALKAGAAVVAVNPLYTVRELARAMKDAEPRAVVTLSRLAPQVGEALADMDGVTVILTEVYDYFPWVWKLIATLRMRRTGGPVPGLRLTTLLRRAAARAPGVPVDPDHLAVLQYTGGTTGVPKGAMLSHRNLVANCSQMRRWLSDMREGEERFLAVVPFFHVYGLTVALNTPVAVGASVICVLMAMFDARRVAETIARYRPTIFPGAPAVYLAINQLKDVGRYNLSSVKVCVSGSASLPREVQAEFERLTGATVVEGYGLTEASPGTHTNPVHGPRKPGSIGLPLPDTDARIVDQDTGEGDVAPGEPGELVIRGPQVMRGYWHAPDETAATLRDGWLYTGDIARMDDDGYFYIVDRKKDLVIIGGLKVYPREIEELLHEHPAVREAAVVGVPHRVRGEQLVAQVVLKNGAPGDPRQIRRELIEFCRSRLASYKVPRRVRIVDALPKSAVGKPLRREIRDAETARSGEED
jgi:long-chain acyl-CoA synthetase